MFKPAAIRVENLYKRFKSNHPPVLNNLTIDFPPGKLTYILGPSGTGKSVLIKHILGLMRPDKGTVWIDKEDLSLFKGHTLAQKRLIFGVLFQNSALFDGMNIFDNVAFPLKEHTNLTDEEIKKKVTKALSLLGMPKGHDKMPNELSGGMRKRVGLARAIIREPSVLLYDEPTTGLDPVTRTTVDDLIETLKRELKLTSIVISHDIPSAILLADKIVFLYKGDVVFSGPPEDFKKSDHPEVQNFIQAENRTVKALTE